MPNRFAIATPETLQNKYYTFIKDEKNVKKKKKVLSFSFYNMRDQLVF